MIFDEELEDKKVVEDKLKDQVYIFRKKQSPLEPKKRSLTSKLKDYSKTSKHNEWSTNWETLLSNTGLTSKSDKAKGIL